MSVVLERILPSSGRDIIRYEVYTSAVMAGGLVGLLFGLPRAHAAGFLLASLALMWFASMFVFISAASSNRQKRKVLFTRATILAAMAGWISGPLLSLSIGLRGIDVLDIASALAVISALWAVVASIRFNQIDGARAGTASRLSSAFFLALSLVGAYTNLFVSFK